ncbi:sporulation membrane protein YtaF [Priestia aryabhattai]|uniref:sporulation membrane protein YtaF n=1 Tax=Priestia TaxID=2800373 RepID=UPI000B9FE0B5|nr:sporulation membrane protein YtaF [Priestia flexa]MDT2045225.1 sporulation membrane protein YtaF [Priestia flexa]OZT12201.1 sporulation membrane protein YtaF [Priestia aryabhattai]USY54698.1 sporulation membrane protein YtaF [Bacillus sp. 1780r2a1]
MISLSLILVAFAVSLDSFSVGLTYGLRKLKIPFKSILIIACCSAFTLTLAMFVGKMITHLFSPAALDTIGGIIFVLLGMWILYQFFRPEDEETAKLEEKIIFKVEIKSIGLVINILKKPTTADLDKSGSITGVEALILGIALSLDAFGAGIAAALLGYSPIILAIAVAAMSFIFLTLGIQIGKWFSKLAWMRMFSFVPGVVLILMGIFRL